MQSQSRIKLASLQGKAIEADTYVLILKAAQQAVARSAMTEAFAQLQKGLDLLKSMLDNSARQQQEFDLRIALGVVSPIAVSPRKRVLPCCRSRSKAGTTSSRTCRTLILCSGSTPISLKTSAWQRYRRRIAVPPGPEGASAASDPM
jgi:hypothetical protein